MNNQYLIIRSVLNLRYQVSINSFAIECIQRKYIYQKERTVLSSNCQNFLFLGAKWATGTKVGLQVEFDLQSFV